MIKNSRILIAGGAGSIGSELVRQLSQHNRVLIFDTNESDGFLLSQELSQQGLSVSFRIGDIRDKQSVRDAFELFKPKMIINAAALKHVSPSQEYPREYVLTNIIGHLNLVEEAQRCPSFKKFIFISTDKSIADFKNVMGATKMCSETIQKSLGRGFISVRFGNVLGSRGSLLEIWEQQHRDGKPLTVTDVEMERYMMTIPDACKLVIEALEIGVGGEVFCLDMGRKIKVIELKKRIYGDYPIKIIGVRNGESLSEELMTDAEMKKAKRVGGFFVL